MTNDLRNNPDKWIRKGFGDMIVNNNISTVWDMNVTGGIYPKEYVLMSTQTKRGVQISKCGSQWDCTILIDIVTRYVGSGNTGSRNRINDIENLILYHAGSINFEGGFTIFDMEMENSTSMDSSDKTEQIFRQLMRFRIKLDELYDYPSNMGFPYALDFALA